VLFIGALDQTIIATAIPTISADLGSASGYTWIGSAYMVAKAASGPIWAKCSDIWGRKLAILTAIMIFAIASIIAALSTSMAMLIAGRALQGVAGSALFQLVYIIIADLFSVRERALYSAFLGFIWIVACGSGPLIGGAFTEYATWRWCFWINLPICGLTFGLLLVILDVHNPRTALRDGLRAIDWYGTFFATSGTLLLLVGLTLGGATFPWDSVQVICLIVFGALMFGFFLYCEVRLATYPLVPMGMFGDRSVVAGFVLAFTHNIVAIGQDYYLPFYFQSVKLASPMQSGLLVLPFLVSEAISDITSGVIIHFTGRYRELIWFGVVVLTLGTGLFIMLDVDTTIAFIIAVGIVAGIGVAFLFQAPAFAIQASVSQADTASAIAAFACVGNIATAFGVVIGGVVFQNSISQRQEAFASYNETIREAFSSTNAAASIDLIGRLPDSQAAQEAFAWSVRNIFICYTAIAGVALVAGFFVEQKVMNKDQTETKTGIENMTRSEKTTKEG
jgi:MFS family permease